MLSLTLCVGASNDATRGQLRTVELARDDRGSLGLSVAGGVGSPLGDAPLLIANIQPDGPAAKTGKLRVSHPQSISSPFHKSSYEGFFALRIC